MRYKWHFDIVKHSKKFYTFSIIVTILGIITLLIHGLSLGVDFKAGTSLDIAVGQAIDKAKAEELFQNAELVPPGLTIGGDNGDRVSARFDKVLNADEVNKIMDQFTKAYGDQVSKEENTVDTELAAELALKALYGVLVACIAISIYVIIRFEWRFAVAAVVSLFHDAFMVISLFSILKLEVNLPFVAAILTIIGYSLNDTVVIFDRIRENTRFAKLKDPGDLKDLVNKSIWQTMTRSINTVITVLIGALCLFIFGSEAIRLFSLAMIFGLFFGAYSSIFIASPIWMHLKRISLGRKRAVVAK
ncbi:MAG: subunit SecF of preprotein translocase [Paenibacillaceae bacterium]|jgi:SecD/SecF fusion protein|nr:subunit SecF of preprotein translocase [Paenibacillaceae bacterium]